MAELCLKEKMEFFYIEDKPLDKLLDELESRYRFQKILFVKIDNTMKDEILSQKRREIYCVFEDEIYNSEVDISCVVCFDKKQIFACQKFCSKKNINYILFLDEYINIDYYSVHNTTNNILGVIINKNKVQKDWKDFAYNFVTDFAIAVFNLTENKISQLYFDDKNFENLSKKYEKVEKILDFFQKNNNFYENINQMLDLYFDFVMMFYNQKSCYINDISLSQNCCLTLVKTQIVLNIYLLFLQKCSPKLVKSAGGAVEIAEQLSAFNENKFWFVNSKFHLDAENIVRSSLKDIENIKKICTSINIERMFMETKQMELNNFKAELYDVSSHINSNSLLKVINYFGLLNFYFI